jgi:hypothetical protein
MKFVISRKQCGDRVSDDKIEALKIKLGLLETNIHHRSSDRLVKPNGTHLYLEYLENSVTRSYLM